MATLVGIALRRAVGMRGTATHASRRWFVFGVGQRGFSLAQAPRSSSSAVFACVGSALGAGFLWAATMKPALAEEEGKGRKGKEKDNKVHSHLLWIVFLNVYVLACLCMYVCMCCVYCVHELPGARRYRLRVLA